VFHVANKATCPSQPCPSSSRLFSAEWQQSVCDLVESDHFQELVIHISRSICTLEADGGGVPNDGLWPTTIIKGALMQCGRSVLQLLVERGGYLIEGVAGPVVQPVAGYAATTRLWHRMPVLRASVRCFIR